MPDGAAQFRHQLYARTPRVWATPALAAINVVVFVAMVAAGVGIMRPSIDGLITWGANYGPRTTGGEWWRLLTSMFVHIGVIHVAMNMIGLWQIGLLVERLLGTRGFLLAYFVSGLCGSVASVAWNPFVVSAGASGAVFGIYGVLIAYLVRHRGSIPKEILRPLQQSTVFFIGLNVIYGFQIKGIDMAAHIGGLVGGFAAALLIGRAPTGSRQRTSPWRELLLVALAAAGIVAGVASLPRVADIQAELKAFGVMERAAVTAYNEALERSRAGQLTDAGLAAVIDKDVLPPWRNQQRRFTEISRLPTGEKKRFADLGRYLSLRDRGWSKLSEALRTDDRGKVDEAVALLKEADKLLASVSEK